MPDRMIVRGPVESDERVFIVVGGGQCGAWAARTIRDKGFGGRILLVSAERHLPYERPPLSKSVLTDEVLAGPPVVFPLCEYMKRNVELRLDAIVNAIDLEDRRIILDSDETYRFDKLLLATGGSARALQVTGSNLDGVVYLRSYDDALKLRSHMRCARNIVVVGGGWIGLEVAAAARVLDRAVTVVEASAHLCGRVLPPSISEHLRTLHVEAGVSIMTGAGVAEIEGGDGAVERVVLTDGSAIDATLVIVATGLVPNIGLARAAGLVVDDGIKTDREGRTSARDIFAAGDVACYPHTTLGNLARLESWESAQTRGRAVAAAMLDVPVEADRHPWFWSDQYGANIQVVGNVLDHDKSVERGTWKSSAALTFFLKEGRLVGAAGINAAREIAVTRRLLETNELVDLNLLSDSAQPLQRMLRKKATV